MRNEGFRKFSDVLLMGAFCGVALLLVLPFGPVFLAACRYAGRSQAQEDTTLARFFKEVGAAFTRPLLTVVVPTLTILLMVVDLVILTLIDVPNASPLRIALGLVAVISVFMLMIAGMSWTPGMNGREWGAQMRDSLSGEPRRTALLAGVSIAFVVILTAAPVLLIVLFGPLCLVSTWGKRKELSAQR
ncbi:MAG: hypothetical protein ACTIJ6_09020 [Leucobacter sp.]